MGDLCIFHLDMDAFYASVEQADFPELRGKPVIVGGSSSRGVVSACSYEARAYGVHSAMPMFQARKLCPDGRFVPVRMDRYLKISGWIMEILSTYAPEIQQISIDEAFLDMSGTELLFGPPEDVGMRIKKAVREATALTISIGIGTSKFIAKMASAKSKPDGLLRIARGNEIAFLDRCRIGDIWGIGNKAEAALASRGIHTVQQLRSFEQQELQRFFGNAAGHFYYLTSRGIDPGIFSEEPKSRSISNEITLLQDSNDQQVLRHILFDLCHQVYFRTLDEKVSARTAFVKIKYSDFSAVSAQRTSSSPFLSAEELFALVWQLFMEKWNRRSVRLLGAGMSSIEDCDAEVQPELFEHTYSRKHRLEKAVSRMQKSGKRVVKASSLLDSSNMLDKKNTGKR